MEFGVGSWWFGLGVSVSPLLLPLAYVAIPKGRAHTSRVVDVVCML